MNDRATSRLIPRLHRYLGLAALPFIVLSVLIALALTHTAVLHALSARLFASLPIPPVALYDTVRPGSLEQVAALAALAHGSDPRVITVGPNGMARVTGFGNNHDHHGGGSGPSPSVTYLIDTDRMMIRRVEDETNSLFILGHNIHAYDFLGVRRLNLGTVTALAMLALVVTGWIVAQQLRGRKSRLGRWHAWTGKVTALLLLLIAFTTLALEFSEEIMTADNPPSLAIPEVTLDERLRPRSIDQGMRVAERATGSRPHSFYLRPDGTMKFTDFAGDNLFTAVYVDGDTMRIKRMEDARNNYNSLVFLLHDGRIFGGMNSLNIADLVGLALLFSGFSGLALHLRRRAARRR
jgi:hypothetical protein